MIPLGRLSILSHTRNAMNDTIAAIATPVGEGGVSLIRISGERSLSIIDTLFRSASGKSAETFSPQHAHFGTLHDPATGHSVDEVLVTYFRAPHSYTCEDIVEITSHGGVFVSSKILQLVLDHGARLAEPGEFTRRAFLNGRLDLSQAEAVVDLIHASSDRALQTALSHLQGKLSEKLNALYSQLLAVLAQLEVSIDFPDEGFETQKKDDLLRQVNQVKADLKRLIESYRQGKIFREGAKIALIGKPNVGKSSLLNALLQEDRAIVTPYPGTTRDVLEEKLRIKDIHINIIDSAGIRKDPEPIEQEGMTRTRASIHRADLVLVLFDNSQPLDHNDEVLIAEVRDKSNIVVLNKSDLPQTLDEEDLVSHLSGAPVVKISAIEGTALEDLMEEIYKFVMSGQREGESLVITRERQRELLDKSRRALDKAGESLQQGLSEELIAVDINLALDSLGAVIGKNFVEDLLDKIFNEFCIGK